MELGQDVVHAGQHEGRVLGLARLAVGVEALAQAPKELGRGGSRV